MRKVRLFSTLSVVGLELCIACLLFFFSPYGYTLLRKLDAQISCAQEEIWATRARIEVLEREIDNWKQYPFYKEKYCCENLQMMHPEATVYYINS